MEMNSHQKVAHNQAVAPSQARPNAARADGALRKVSTNVPKPSN